MRARLFLGMWAVLTLVVGVTVVLADAFEGGDAADQVVGSGDVTSPGGTGDPTSTTTGTEASVVPGPGQHRVEGTVTAVHLEGAVLDPREVTAPITVVSDRGFGNGGELTGVTVEGEPSTIVWDGGRPLVLSSGGALVVEPSTIDLVPEGLRVHLGGGVHSLTPATYQLDTPVAVGTSGIATPRDSVSFTAGSSALFEARGDAALVLSAQGSRTLLGPGLVHLEGSLQVEDASGTRTQPTFDVTLAAFELTLTPDGAGGWTIAGLVDEAAIAD